MKKAKLVSLIMTLFMLALMVFNCVYCLNNTGDSLGDGLLAVFTFVYSFIMSCVTLTVAVAKLCMLWARSRGSALAASIIDIIFFFLYLAVAIIDVVAGAPVFVLVMGIIFGILAPIADFAARAIATAELEDKRDSAKAENS